MSKSAWGDAVTRYFYDLTPERVLDAVEAAGYRTTGLCYPLNSFENRVYEVEIEEDADRGIVRRTPASLRRIVKFYRPGRWTSAQILEEHRFLQDLVEAEITAVAPEPFEGGSTLAPVPGVDIQYTIFPKVGGRVPDELSDDRLLWLGRLLARLHSVGAAREAPHRIALTPETYGLANLEYLLAEKWLPDEIRANYEATVRAICALAEERFRGVPIQRIHGDCHPGNLLWDREPFFVDFDDMVRGPVVQDLWLLLVGQGERAAEAMAVLVEGYEQMRPFDRAQLGLVEPLRALRFVHYTAWLARRWKDPAFPRAFPHFGTPRYWAEQLQDLREQLAKIQEGAWA